LLSTVETGRSMSDKSGAPCARSLLTSLAFHVFALGFVLLLPAGALLHSARPKKPLDVVFYRPRPPIEVPARAVRHAGAPGPIAAAHQPDGGGRPAPALKPKPNAAPGPDAPGTPALPPGPESSPAAETQPKAGNAGILAFRDKLASLSKDKVTPRLGTDARYSAADDVGKPSSRSGLTTTAAGSSGGINAASLNRSVGGGGGGGGGGSGTGGMGSGSGGGFGGGGSGGGGGIPVTRASSPIASVAGVDRPKARGGPGAARTDEEIQIVFDRYKASFYRLYNRELRNNPALKGQMVLRLTIEPDGSVSMCALQSTDMDAPDLATQVVSRVRGMNFGAKEVLAVTIVYPIDFLPAS
jgi:hypothetical protein